MRIKKKDLDKFWKCPKCGAKAHRHGKGGKNGCISTLVNSCEGLICECWEDGKSQRELSNKPNHGTPENPCLHANCYHCGWGGVFPKQPKKKKTPEKVKIFHFTKQPIPLKKWEKRALLHGWNPPVGWNKEVPKDLLKGKTK